MSERFDGYSIFLAEDEEGDYIAHFVEMPSVSAFASSAEQALAELEYAWNGVKESYRKHNQAVPVAPSKKQYSGQFNVRIDKRVHRDLAIEASLAGISLNALVAQKLYSSVTHYAT